MKYHFHTSLNKEECIKRLSDKTNPDNSVGTGNAVGKVNGDTFYFEMHGSVAMKGIRAIGKRFEGELQSKESGTDIRGTIVSSKANKNLILIAIIALMLMIVLAVIKGNTNPYQIAFYFLIPIFVYVFVPKMSKNENIKFIKDTLEAQEVL